MSDPFEPRIREALARLMASAPQPKPLPERSHPVAPPVPGRRGVPAWVLAPVAAVVVAAAIGIPLYLTRGSQEGSDLGRVAPSLSEGLDATDAVVVVEGITSLDLVTMESGAQYQRFDVTVQEALYEVEMPVQAIDPGYPRELPPLAPGALLVYEPLGSEASPGGAPAVSQVAGVSLAPGERAVLLLGYWAPEVYPDWPAAWSVVGLARLEPDGNLTFLDDPQGLMGTGLAAAAAGAPPGLSQVEQLVAWLTEKDAARGGAAEGPMQAAYDASLTPWTLTELTTTTLAGQPMDGEGPENPMAIGETHLVAGWNIAVHAPATDEPPPVFANADGTFLLAVPITATWLGDGDASSVLADAVRFFALGADAEEVPGQVTRCPRPLPLDTPDGSPEGNVCFSLGPAAAEEFLLVAEDLDPAADHRAYFTTGISPQVHCSTGTCSVGFLAGPELTREEFLATEAGRILEAAFVGGDAAAENQAYLQSRGFTIVSDNLVFGYRAGRPVAEFALQDGRLTNWGVGDGSARLASDGLTAPGWNPVTPLDPAATTIPITVAGGFCAGEPGSATEIRLIEVVEDESTVQVVVWTQEPARQAGYCAGVGIMLDAQIELAAPLGTRTLLDAGVFPAAAVGQAEPEPDTEPQQVDLVAAYAEAIQETPGYQLTLPWGEGPGQVSYSADFGPCCLAVTADGALVVADRGRLQVWDGAAWRVFYEPGGDRPPLEDGIAALDSGLIAAPAAAAPGDHRVLLLDLDGNIVGQGDAIREANNAWWGGEDLWAALGSPPFTRWARVTRAGALIPFAEQEETETFSSSALTFNMAYDRRGDYDPAYNITTVTVVAAGETRQWLVYGGDVAGAPRFALLDEGVVGLWHAGTDWLVVTMRPDQPVSVLRIPLHQWVQTGTFDFFGVHENRLYLLQTYPDGARIEVYELP